MYFSWWFFQWWPEWFGWSNLDLVGGGGWVRVTGTLEGLKMYNKSSLWSERKRSPSRNSFLLVVLFSFSGGLIYSVDRIWISPGALITGPLGVKIWESARWYTGNAVRYEMHLSGFQFLFFRFYGNLRFHGLVWLRSHSWLLGKRALVSVEVIVIWLILPVVIYFVSKIKPCMSKFTLSHGKITNGSLDQSRFLRWHDPSWITVAILDLIHAYKAPNLVEGELCF